MIVVGRSGAGRSFRARLAQMIRDLSFSEQQELEGMLIVKQTLRDPASSRVIADWLGEHGIPRRASKMLHSTRF